MSYLSGCGLPFNDSSTLYLGCNGATSSTNTRKVESTNEVMVSLNLALFSLFNKSASISLSDTCSVSKLT